MKQSFFKNAWITPDNNIFYIGSQSHDKFIDKLSIRQYLYTNSNTIKWSDTEINNHDNLDIVIIALKLGFIRITTYYNQFAVQIKTSITNEQENLIFDIYRKLNNELLASHNIEFTQFTLEIDFKQITTFNNIYELLSWIKK